MVIIIKMIKIINTIKYIKTARPQEFTEGMRVYLKVDHHKPDTSPKRCELFTGPFQSFKIKNGVLTKLQNMYTSRCLKNWIHASKLRKVSDNRDILQKRFQTLQHSKQPKSPSQHTLCYFRIKLYLFNIHTSHKCP
jgi:hypothetical protein